MSYSSDCRGPIALTLSVVLKCLPVTYYSVLQQCLAGIYCCATQCLTKVITSVLLQCLYMSYSRVCQCPISVSLLS